MEPKFEGTDVDNVTLFLMIALLVKSDIEVEVSCFVVEGGRVGVAMVVTFFGVVLLLYKFL